MRRLTKITAALLLASAAVSIAAMMHGAGGFSLNWFYLWVLAPYALFLICWCLPRNSSLPRERAGLITAVLVLAFTALMYIDAMWFSKSSTSALVFAVVPVWLVAGGLLVWALAWGIGHAISQRDHPTPN